MKILSSQTTSIEQMVQEAVRVLNHGGLVIYPTETTYGVGVLATDQAAVNKLLTYKTRREGKPLSIAVSDQNMAKRYVSVNDQADKLYQQFLPGPVTIISQGLSKLAQGVESEFGTLGVRIPDYPLVMALVKTLNQPITATSANASGKKRPYSIENLLKSLSAKQKALIDLILDVGLLPTNPPSIVIDTTLSTPVVMRNNQKIVEQIFPGQAINKVILTSNSQQETAAIAGKLILKNWENLKQTGLVIALSGPLGAGKTVFTKGAAKFLQIKQLVKSPTYTYLEEYKFSRHGVRGKLYHADVWKIDEPSLAARLELEQLFGPKQLLIIEWFEQIAEYFLPIIKKQAIPFINISIRDLGQGRRELLVQQKL